MENCFVDDGTPKRVNRPPIQSSPVNVYAIDPSRQINDYIQYLIEKNPGQRDLFEKAGEKLTEEGLDLE